MALQAGRVGVHPSEVLPDGRLKYTSIKQAVQLPSVILEADSGAINGWIDIGLAYRDMVGDKTYAAVLTSSDLEVIPCTVMYVKPDEVSSANGRIIYRAYRPNSGAVETLVIDTIEDTENGHITSWQWIGGE